MALTLQGLDGRTYEIRQGNVAADHYQVWRGDDDMGSFVIDAGGVLRFQGRFTGKIDLATMNGLEQNLSEHLKSTGGQL